MLKPHHWRNRTMTVLPAAFGRLCVETCNLSDGLFCVLPAAFGRLCVETKVLLRDLPFPSQPPSGGCVLKQKLQVMITTRNLPAAFGRLCVETFVL